MAEGGVEEEEEEEVCGPTLASLGDEDISAFRAIRKLLDDSRTVGEDPLAAEEDDAEEAVFAPALLIFGSAPLRECSSSLANCDDPRGRSGNDEESAS